MTTDSWRSTALPTRDRPHSFDPRQQLADRLIRPLREGKPELGWAGDQALGLVFYRPAQRWELWDMERNVIIMAGPPGQDINEEAINLLIRKLVQADTHRDGNSAEDIVERTIRQNDEADRRATEKAADAIAEPLAKFYHEAGRTLGVVDKQRYFT